MALLAHLAFVTSILHFCAGASTCKRKQGLQLKQKKTMLHTDGAITSSRRGVLFSRTFTVVESDCLPAGDWLGATDTADACARRCYFSQQNDHCCNYTPGGAMAIVWVKHGDKNCKCADTECVRSHWPWAETYTYQISATVWPWRLEGTWENQTCSPAENWLGSANTVEECVTACTDSRSKWQWSKTVKVVWVKNEKW